MNDDKRTPITPSNVAAFLKGNWMYYKNMLHPSPLYLKEQYHYRLSLCSDCIESNQCQHCTCPPLKKAWVPESCNAGERFPDLMNHEQWEVFKQQHNIDIDQILQTHETD